MSQRINLTSSPVSIGVNVQWLLATSNGNGNFCVATGTTQPQKDVYHWVPDIALGPVDQVWAWSNSGNVSIVVSSG